MRIIGKIDIPESEIYSPVYDGFELWKPVTGYENCYSVSNFGHVRSNTRKIKCKAGKYRTIKGQLIKTHLTDRDRPFIRVNKKGVSKNARVHRLVGNEFVRNPDNKPEINHLDGNPLNNHFQNLEWCTHKENMAHAAKMGLMRTSEYQKQQTSKANRGSGHGYSKLHESDIPKIREMRENGLTYSEIGDRFGVGRETIGNIIRGNTWTHV